MECSGASAAEGSELEADYATVITSGTSQADVRAKGLQSVHASGASNVTASHVSTDELAIELGGTSQCTVSGEVNKLAIQADGAAAVHAPSLKAQFVQVDLSGTSQIEVEVVKSITGSASGASTVRCLGNPTAQSVQTSGTATLERS